MKLGFIGLGRMGRPMAQNLARAGYELHVYTRNTAKREEFARQVKVQAAGSVAELVDLCDVVLTMLADEDAVESTYNSGLESCREGQLWLEMSTISPRLSVSLANLVQEKGANYLDAPVSGSVDAAQERRLVFMLGCPPPIDDSVTAVLGAMGNKYYFMGKVGAGHAAKLLINSVIHAQNQTAAEMLTLAHAVGLQIDALMDLLVNSAAGSPMFKFRKDLYCGHDDSVSFALRLATKDMRLVSELGSEHGLDLPQMYLNHEMLASAVEHGYGERDMSAICAYMREINTADAAK